MEQSNSRTRMNLSLNSKGKVQWDITAEYDTPELTAAQLADGIDLMRNVIKTKNLVEVSE